MRTVHKKRIKTEISDIMQREKKGEHHAQTNDRRRPNPCRSSEI